MPPQVLAANRRDVRVTKTVAVPPQFHARRLISSRWRFFAKKSTLLISSPPGPTCTDWQYYLMWTNWNLHLPSTSPWNTSRTHLKERRDGRCWKQGGKSQQLRFPANCHNSIRKHRVYNCIFSGLRTSTFSTICIITKQIAEKYLKALRLKPVFWLDNSLLF